MTNRYLRIVQWCKRRTVGGAIANVSTGSVLLVLLLSAWPASSAQDAPAGTFAVTVFDTPTYSSPIAMSADKNHIWVVNPDDDSVSVIANLGGTPSVIKNITNVGDEPQSIALDVGTAPGQYRAYVANAADNSVTVINVTASTASSITTVVQKALITGAEPYNIVASPDGKRIFVANSVQDTISVIDTSNQSVIGAVDLRNSICNDPDRNRHFQPRGLAVTLNNDRLYVTRFLSFTGGANAKQGTDDGKVGVVCQLNINTNSLNIADYTPATRIEIGAQDSGFKIPGNANVTSAYPNQMQSIVIRGEHAYLPNIASSPLGPLRFNVDTHAFVNVLDNVATGTPVDASAAKFKNLHLGARIPEQGKTRLFFANPWAIAFTNQSGAGTGYVVSAGSDLLVKVNVDAAGKLDFTAGISTTRYIDLNDSLNPATQGEKAGKNPLGIVIRDTRAFVMNYISRNVSVVNLSSDTVESVLKLTNLPSPASDEEQLQVGAEIFFSSRGVFEGGKVNRLSSEGWQNCASCHFAGLTDGNIWQFGSGPRKSVPLNGTWSPHNPDDQRVLNYSAIFDEVQDFELNIRNVSGPGPLSAGPSVVLDPNHGLIISDTGNIDAAPRVVAPFLPIANANLPQVTMRLPGSSTSWPALDAMKELVRFAIRTPNGALTSDEVVGGLNATTVSQGRRLFFQAGCQKCHGGTKWTISNKDFTSPPAAAEVATETDLNGAGTPPDPNLGQFLPRFLFDIKSFNLNVAGVNPLNQVPGATLIGAVEKDTSGRDGLGIDYNNDGKGVGFNIPSLLAIWHVPPYYHNGACETLDCVLANPNHRAAGLRAGQSDPLTDPNKQKAVVEWLKTLDAATPFPLNLTVLSHDIFIDPPVVFKGQAVTVGANVSLFGTRADLKNLLEDQGLTSLTVRFALDPNDGAATVDVQIPTADINTRFKQDFGQAVISTTWSIPANPSGNVGTVTVTMDSDNQLTEDNENDNQVSRTISLPTSPSDNTPPTVNGVFISDDNPFNDNDAITVVRDVKVKIQASDPIGSNNATPSGVDKFCIVHYTYDVVNRRWVESACTFAALPAPEAGTTDTFIVATQLQAREGVAYTFVWIKDKAGNISRRPGFDVISFIPSLVIRLNRNDVRLFRIPLLAGQTLKLDFTIQSGDVDVAVFDDFRNPAATRIALSANNGMTPESVTLTGPGNFQVEVDAMVNSRFTVATTTAVEAVVPASALPSVIAAGGDTPIIAGPPAERAAIEDERQLCYSLVLSHTGTGENPTANPSNSSSCSSGTYLSGESIILSASPTVGWAVIGWTGTANDASTATSNSLIMPAANHMISVIYAQLPTATPTSTFTPTPTSTPPPPAGGDAYEPNDTCVQAHLIPTDGSLQQHTFHTTGDIDWVRFDTQAAVRYRIEVQALADSPADVDLELYPACDQLPNPPQNPSFSPNVRLDFIAPQNGTIFLRLTNHIATVAGANVAYQISVRPLDENPPDRALIIVAGRLKGSDRLQSNIHQVTKRVYELFQKNGYDSSNIQYLATDSSLAGYTAAATKENLRAAIITWAAQQLEPNGVLTLYLIDHGKPDLFFLDELNGQRLTPTELDQWLTQLESQVQGVKINVIIEACQSGSFITQPANISGENRLVVTSTTAEADAKASYAGAYFSDHFLTGLAQGINVYASFVEARRVAKQIFALQEAWVDGDGDGQPNEPEDDAVAASRGFEYPGTFDDPWPPHIFSVQRPPSIVNASGQIQADVRDDVKVSLVWGVVYPPDYTPPPAGQELQPEVLPTFLLSPQGDNLFAGQYTGFTQAGVYRIILHAEDNDGLKARPLVIEVNVGSQLFLPLIAHRR